MHELIRQHDNYNEICSGSQQICANCESVITASSVGTWIIELQVSSVVCRWAQCRWAMRSLD